MSYLKRIFDYVDAGYLKKTLIEILSEEHDHDEGHCSSHDQPDLVNSRMFDPEELNDSDEGEVTAKAKNHPAESLAKYDADIKFITDKIENGMDIGTGGKAKHKPGYKEIKSAISAYMELSPKLERKLARNSARISNTTDVKKKAALQKEEAALKTTIKSMSEQVASGKKYAELFHAHTPDEKELAHLEDMADQDEDKPTRESIVIDRQALLQALVEPIFEAYPDRFHARITTENSKLANEGITAFSLPEMFTCPGKGSCKDVCYARSGQMIFKNSIIKRWVNYYAAGGAGITDHEKEKRKEFSADMKEMLAGLKSTGSVTAKDLDTTIGYKEKGKTKGRKTIKVEDYKGLVSEKANELLAAKKAKEAMLELLQAELKVEKGKVEKDKRQKLNDKYGAKIDKTKTEHNQKIAMLTAELKHVKDNYVAVHPDRLDKDGKPITWKWDAVRIHDAGDFYHPDYIYAWIDILKHFHQTNPELQFYAYTKIYGVSNIPGLQEAYQELIKQPNFKVIQSTGSNNDSAMNLKHPKAIIFPSVEAAKKAGFMYSSNSDRVALDPNTHNVGLVVHGTGSKKYRFSKHIADLPQELQDYLKSLGIEEVVEG